MVGSEAREHSREAAGGARRLENGPAHLRMPLERTRRQRFPLFSGSGHFMGVAVALETLRIFRRGHWPTAIVFLMTRGTCPCMNDIRLVEQVTDVALLATAIDSDIREFQCRAEE